MATPADMLNQNQGYTAADYASWTGERWELIDGAAYDMSPAPSWGHQELVGELFGLMRNFLRGKPCKPMISPLDIKFDDKTVVQPDITVWCPSEDAPEAANEAAPASQEAQDGLTPASGKGALRLTVAAEVLSPSDPKRDLIKKLRLYYWIIDPEDKLIIRHALTDGRYSAEYFEEGAFTSEALGGFSFALKDFFERVE